MRNYMKLHGNSKQAWDVFINHRGVDTKRTVVRLLYENLVLKGARPFLDSENLKPGDKLFHNIENAIQGCKVGVAVFSPTYCHSYFCLHELSLLLRSNKRIVPIFYDIKPSQLRVFHHPHHHHTDDVSLSRFTFALQEAKHIVGLPFDSSKGDWSELVRKATDAVMRNLVEVEEENRLRMISYKA